MKRALIALLLAASVAGCTGESNQKTAPPTPGYEQGMTQDFFQYYLGVPQGTNTLADTACTVERTPDDPTGLRHLLIPCDTS